jgi:hypothetical protein
MKLSRFVLAALAGVGVVVALSCRDPVAPPAPARAFSLLDAIDSTYLFDGLLTCSPLPADSVTQTIGAAGGTLVVGPHTLSIPPGALSAPVTITAVAPSDTVNRVRFAPQGLTFQTPASLTLSYANCAQVLGLPAQIAYTTDSLAILEILSSVDNGPTATVTAPLQHFSDYAVAW